ncbi:MAG: 16S rRNA (adenine(1518)-N(6)/adenine(1519)-N(6))-dimethyltransferase RsmA, partial [Gemmatimonadaceae bacterium]
MTAMKSRGPGHPRQRKRFGQHFLTDPSALGRIAGALELTGSETVIEIGPGRGALTELLAARAGRLVAIEIDRDLARVLADRYAGDARIEIVQGDVLQADLHALAAGEPFLLVGNVPYYITTPIIFLGLRRPRPTRTVYLVQREVAERITASPGSRTYGALSVNVQAVAHAELLAHVSRRAFRPAPAVDSAVLCLVPRAQPAVAPEMEDQFRALVQGAFALRRKQMRRVLRTLGGMGAGEAETILREVTIDPEARPETLAPEDFARLLVAAVAAGVRSCFATSLPCG